MTMNTSNLVPRYCLPVALVATLGGCKALALPEPETRQRVSCFLDDLGNTKDCHREDVPESMDWRYETARAHCLLAAEGRFVNCRMIQGPPVSQYSILEMLRKLRPKPMMVDGKPTDTDVTLTFHVSFKIP